MFGSISEWFYRSLLGINPAAPGFEKIIIKPQPAGDLTFAKGAYHSVKGVIESSWRIDKKSFTLAVSIPANTSAEVWVPVKENSSVSSMGKVVDNVTYKEGYAIINIGSGQHNFSSQFK
jgi:alpha-L-rhamnosidase